MDERACVSKQLKWNKFHFYGDRLSGKDFHGDYYRQTACLRKSLRRNREQSPLIRQQVVWRNYTEQKTEKQKSVKACTRSLEKEHLRFMEIVVVLTKIG